MSNGGGRVQDPLLGTITVFREWDPREDEIEYTVYFTVDGIKYRHDFRLKTEDFENIVQEEQENFVRNKMIDNILAGEFSRAGGEDAVRPTDHAAVVDKLKGFQKMREVTRDQHWNSPKVEEEPTGEVLQSSPPEHELALLTLALRQYDVLMAILTHFDEETANKIFDAHSKGEHFNPPIYIPVPGDTEKVPDGTNPTPPEHGEETSGA